MASFLDKLKKGMGVATEDEGEEIKEPAPKIRKKRQAKNVEPAFIKTSADEEIKPPRELKIEAKIMKIENKKKEIKIEEPDSAFVKASTSDKSSADKPTDKEEWFEEPAGQLAVDVYQTEQDLIVQTAIAGIKPGNLEVTVERDIVAIRGIRQKPSEENGDYFTKECYWGPFSREIISPVEINPDLVEAIMEEGVLTIRLPKILREKKRTITVKA
jgi:HSP20 family protein